MGGADVINKVADGLDDLSDFSEVTGGKTFAEKIGNWFKELWNGVTQNRNSYTRMAAYSN